MAKKTTQTKTTTPVETKPVETPPPTPAKKTSGKKTKEVAVTPPVVEETNTVVTETSDDTLSLNFMEFMSKLQSINQSISALRSDFRSLEKKAQRELKMAQKASQKRKRAKGNRSPSGFVKPTLISDELATFLEKPAGSQMARTEVTREINAYIRANSLQDKNNGRKINADTKLSKLLKLKKTDELTYFNLQRYMSPHFAKGGALTVEPQAVA